MSRLHLRGLRDGDFAAVGAKFIDANTRHLPLVMHRLVGNRLLLSPPSHSMPADSRVEWAYAFDVHTNAFFPLFLTLYIVQLFLYPVVTADRWVSLLVGNTLYAAG
jgi:hypothetical protein